MLCSRFTLGRGTGSYGSAVLRGLSRLLVAAFVAGAVLVAPSAALACNGGPSAVNVYKECVPTGSGSKPTGGAKGTGTKPIAVPKQAARALAHAKGNKKLLYQLVTNPSMGATRALQSSHAGRATAPSALGSAFDLGSGPTALLALLAGTAFLLLAATGLRGWRRWRSRT
jgi:hypothetical protein